MEEFIAALPKVELHVHLVGSASVDTVLELAARHPEAGVPTTRAELAEFYRFRSFDHFVRVYLAVSNLVRTSADLTRLVTGLAADLAAQQVRYAEVTVTVFSHLLAGLTDDEARTHLSMWAMFAAPLIAGNDPARTSPAARDLLTDPEVIAVDQDPAGIEGTPVRAPGDQQVWAKPI